MVGTGPDNVDGRVLLMDARQLKIEAARVALDHVADGARLGIGTGSTAEEFVRLLAEKVATGLKVVGVPTSERTATLCTELGVPLSGLDVYTLDELSSQLRSAAKERGLSVILATSRFETAARFADTIAVLADSYIQQTGSPEEVYEHPLSTTVARSTGRCNIFEARRLTSTKFEIPEFQTIEGEHRFFTEKADIGKLGAIDRNVALAIRPENISISFGASFPEDNLLKGVVTDISFLGPVTVVQLDANGLLLEAMVFRLVGLNVGDECMLGLPPERIRILRD